MTPLLFIATLCVSYSGGEDCSFTWEIQDIEHPNYEGWFDGYNKTITGEDPTALAHEAKHVLCYLEQQDSMDCHNAWDAEDLVEKLKSEERTTGVMPPQHNPIIQLKMDGIVL